MRRLSVTAAILAGMLVAAVLGYRALFDAEARLVLVEVSGGVAVSGRLGARAASVGDALAGQDRVVAAADGRAVLALEDASGRPAARLTLAPSTVVEVREVGASGVRVALEGGRVQATVRPGAGRVGIAAAGREVVAEDADVTVARDADVFGADVSRGSVDIREADGGMRLDEGSRYVAATGAEPLVAPADDALLLFVEPLPAPRTRAGEAVVTGTTQPGATVRVGRDGAWVSTRADARGAFRVAVPLVEGDNALRVEARDVFGNLGVGDVRVTRDTTAPSVGVEVRY